MRLVRPAPDEITVRELVPADRDLVVAVFERLSPRSRFLRFLSPLPSLPEPTLARLLDVDGHDHVALVAVRDGTGAAARAARRRRRPWRAGPDVRRPSRQRGDARPAALARGADGLAGGPRP